MSQEVLISFEEGVATFYAMKNAEDRGVLFYRLLLKFIRADCGRTQPVPRPGTQCLQDKTTDQPPGI